jgi:hypothetical protein
MEKLTPSHRKGFDNFLKLKELHIGTFRADQVLFAYQPAGRGQG